MDYLHQCGIIAHRDFKPENTILTNNNQIIQIIDFIWGKTNTKGQLSKTECGYPFYVAPEIIKVFNIINKYNMKLLYILYW